MRAALLLALLAACSFQPGTFTNGVVDARDSGGANDDSDGDGVLDGTDNCISVANPDQHDWDHDTHGDACDGCPHLASTPDPDADGDGVGDACDPRPAVGGDHRVHWVAFYSTADIAGWVTSAGTWMVANGKLEQTTTSFSLLDSPFLYGDIYFAARAELVSTANEVGFCGRNIPVGQQYYCCGAYIGGGNIARAVSYWATSGGQIADPRTFPAGAAGDIVDFVGTMTSTKSQCQITKGTTTVMSETNRGASQPGSAVFYTTVPAKYLYAFVVTIGSP